MTETKSQARFVIRSFGHSFVIRHSNFVIMGIVRLSTMMRIALVIVSVLALAFPSRGASPEFIDSTIKLAKNWIYKQQAGDNWEKPYEQHGDQKSGQTALAVYALLTAGESPQDPR